MSTDLEKKLSHYRISKNEFSKIVEILGREPEGVEWAVFSALWSEHCSYKSSKVHLKKFYSKNHRVKESFGENAGVIDLGLGERVAFKMESHNHPSYISPYQGAATGVGGILRDIFTMGARPVALANYLCFGNPNADRMTSIVDGVVKGIAGYGNCVGVPMLAGMTEFHEEYNQNVLVNAFALGLFAPEEKVFTSSATGLGNFVVYVGAKTGRDGVHGASMASESFDEESESKKPTVQIGDPFFEKLLIEGCLEVMKEGLVEGIQDMGAAGLTSSSFEMAAKGGVGLKLDLDKVPQRDKGITAEEILLSESQERMLLICRPENFHRIEEVFKKWSLDAAVIGEVIDGENIQLYWQGGKLCELSPVEIVDNAPVYDREFFQWKDKNRVNEQQLKLPSFDEFTFESLFESLAGIDKSWIYDQYDQRVGAKTARDLRDPVGVIFLKDSKRALGVTLGCRPYLMKFDAKQGALDSVFYPALKLAVKGFEPLALTDCLNFGNPEKPEVMSEFVVSVESMSAACKALDTPVISGNVSFYNETMNKNIISTPSTAMVGLKEDIHKIPQSYFVQAEEEVYILSDRQLVTNGYWGISKSSIEGYGEIHIDKAKKFVKWVRELALSNLCTSTNVVGRFGVLNTLLHMSSQGVGVKVFPEVKDKSLFEEVCYQIVVSVPHQNLEPFRKFINQNIDIVVEKVGITQEEGFHWRDHELASKNIVDAGLKGWEKYFESLA
ncbi:MAG: phosphoribosylformylglycinamidine synthase subunit PurL [Bdellovibrionales bacterium]|nr:phosphoribosylformylglycinamidine synthase subunit PurL [Bdellovibrionales bacterium]